MPPSPAVILIDPGLTREQFLYDLPEGSIAQSAIEPRHAARLLDTRTMSDHSFVDLPDLLDPGDLLVVNETKVRSARLLGTRVGTGGRVELLVLAALGDGSWEGLCRPARRLRPGVRLQFGGLGAEVIGGPEDGRIRVQFDATSTTDLEAWFEQVGEMPLPPYFNGRLSDPARYQTVFANTVGSAAAPTAALHFTPTVLASLQSRGVAIARVDLQVGLDTFRPMTANRLADHVMHFERFSVPKEAADSVTAARLRGGRVFAVGTTVTRTLEAAADGAGGVTPMEATTDLFITPGYQFKVIDGLITNFHVPGSTLVALVAAAVGDDWRTIYETALGRGYRFLSFGDAMLAAVPRDGQRR